MSTESAVSAAAVDGFWRLAAALDARLSVRGGCVDSDNPPAPGDTVVYYDGERVRTVVFDEVERPFGPVWIIGILRTGQA